MKTQYKLYVRLIAFIVVFAFILTQAGLGIAAPSRNAENLRKPQEGANANGGIEQALTIAAAMGADAGAGMNGAAAYSNAIGLSKKQITEIEAEIDNYCSRSESRNVSKKKLDLLNTALLESDVVTSENYEKVFEILKEIPRYAGNDTHRAYDSLTALLKSGAVTSENYEKALKDFVLILKEIPRYAGNDTYEAYNSLTALLEKKFLDLDKTHNQNDIINFSIGINYLSEIILNHPEAFDNEFKILLADTLAVVGPLAGSHLESLIAVCQRPDIAILSNREANAIMTSHQAWNINIGADLPVGSIGSVQYRVLGYASFATHPAIASQQQYLLDILWLNPFKEDASYDAARYTSQPYTGAYGFQNMAIKDKQGNTLNIIGYLGEPAGEDAEEGIKDKYSDNNKVGQKSEAEQVYSINGAKYKRDVKNVNGPGGKIYHVAFLGYQPNLTLAYYQFVESGAVFSCCINADYLKKIVSSAKKEAGWQMFGEATLFDSARQRLKSLEEIKDVLKSPSSFIPEFDTEIHKGNLSLTDEDIEGRIPLLKKKLIWLKDEFPGLFDKHIKPSLKDNESIEALSWDRVIQISGCILGLVEELFNEEQFRLADEFYNILPLEELPEAYMLSFANEAFTEEGLRLVARYLNNKFNLSIKTDDLEEIGPSEIVSRLSKSLAGCMHEAQLLKGLAKIFTYNEVTWVETAGESITIGQAWDEHQNGYQAGVQHFPVFKELAGLVGAPKTLPKQTDNKPYVYLAVSTKELSKQFGLGGRQIVLSQGRIVKEALAVLGISNNDISGLEIESNGVLLNADAALIQRQVLNISASAAGNGGAQANEPAVGEEFSIVDLKKDGYKRSERWHNDEVVYVKNMDNEALSCIRVYPGVKLQDYTEYLNIINRVRDEYRGSVEIPKFECVKIVKTKRIGTFTFHKKMGYGIRMTLEMGISLQTAIDETYLYIASGSSVADNLGEEARKFLEAVNRLSANSANNRISDFIVPTRFLTEEGKVDSSHEDVKILASNPINMRRLVAFHDRSAGMSGMPQNRTGAVELVVRFKLLALSYKETIDGKIAEIAKENPDIDKNIEFIGGMPTTFEELTNRKGEILEAIKRIKPDMIVVHMPNGEFGLARTMAELINISTGIKTSGLPDDDKANWKIVISALAESL